MDVDQGKRKKKKKKMHLKWWPQKKRLNQFNPKSKPIIDLHYYKVYFIKNRPLIIYKCENFRLHTQLTCGDVFLQYTEAIYNETYELSTLEVSTKIKDKNLQNDR